MIFTCLYRLNRRNIQMNLGADYSGSLKTAQEWCKKNKPTWLVVVNEDTGKTVAEYRDGQFMFVTCAPSESLVDVISPVQLSDKEKIVLCELLTIAGSDTDYWEQSVSILMKAEGIDVPSKAGSIVDGLRKRCYDSLKAKSQIRTVEMDKCVLCGSADQDKKSDHLRECFKESQYRLSNDQYKPHLTYDEMSKVQSGSNPICSNMRKCRERRGW